MRIVDDERVARFVGERVGATIFPPWTAMGIEKDGEIIGGALFNCFTRHDVQVTIAGRGWTKGFLAEMGNYIFKTMGCVRFTAETEQPSVVRMVERVGGQIEGMKRNQFGPGRDAFVLGVLAEEYRFKR